ncbi:endonuclease V [cyanobacterium endosymbiont of Rhopalodia gibberula]|uniref:endonuclease V n=1 Tax=cyanobacterium endosymbiont of Rhopalodia gibberula TaxID=1763363 RepID=UPI000E65AF63
MEDYLTDGHYVAGVNVKVYNNYKLTQVATYILTLFKNFQLVETQMTYFITIFSYILEFLSFGKIFVKLKALKF